MNSMLNKIFTISIVKVKLIVSGGVEENTYWVGIMRHAFMCIALRRFEHTIRIAYIQIFIKIAFIFCRRQIK